MHKEKWYHWVIPLIIAFLLVARLVGGVPILPELSVLSGYAFCILIYLWLKPTINIIYVAFLGLLALAMSLADPDPLFRSEMRFGLFGVVMLVVSPLLSNPQIRTIRERALVFICRASVILSVASFFAYFLGINLMYSQYTDSGFVEEYESNVGGFGGLFIHSMVLGPMASIAALYMLKEAVKKKHIPYWIVWAMCVGAVFMSASRAALFSLAVSMVVMLQALSKTKEKRNALIVIALLLLLIVPYAGVLTNRVIEKQHQREELGQGVLDSRGEKITYRIEEFLSEPIHGVGFGSVDPHCGDNYNRATGAIEPGSSWLAVLSMSGLLGFIPFLIIVFYTWHYLVRSKKMCAEYLLFKGLYVFILLHLLFEGYLFSGGNPLCLLAWLIFDCAYEAGYEYTGKRVGHGIKRVAKWQRRA